MGYQRGPDRNEVELFPQCLDDYVTESAEVRFIDAFVEGLDLEDLGFTHARPKKTGRPPYHPADLIKLFVYGYLNSIPSGRKLEAECHRNIEVLWLLRRIKPDFKTLCDFRRNNRSRFKELFKQFNLLCRRLGLFGAQLVAIDGSKFKALNRASNNYTSKQLAESISRIEERIDEYLRRLEEADQEDDSGPSEPDKEDFKKKLEYLKDRKKEHQKLLEQAQANGGQVSLSDPDSRKMSVSNGGYSVGYNAQIGVDAAHHLIVAQEVVQDCNDRHQLADMATESCETLGTNDVQIVADKGYHEGEALEELQAAGMHPYVPQQGTTSGRSRDGSKVFSKEQFRYDYQSDSYHCPGGQVLSNIGATVNKGKPVTTYRNRKACAACSIRNQCTKGTVRVLRRRPHDDVVETVAARVAAHPEIIQKRKEVVEHVFGTLKHNGHGRFLLRGLEGVRAELSLGALVYNLRRVFNLIPVPKLIEAVV